MVKNREKDNVNNKGLSLKLIHEEQHVADLTYDLDRRIFHLLYSPQWLQKGFALSPHLPMFGEIPPENIQKFLENLLPEGEALRTLSRTLQMESSNIFALVTAIGRDATGAFSFSMKDEKTETFFRPIPIKELKQRVLDRANKSINVWEGKPRLSLAGVQEKLGVTLRGGEYGLGEGQLASTHILKFSKKNQHLVLNEYFCMTLAKKIGIAVANVDMIDLGERVLRVERFDRKWKDHDNVSRIHVIDGCQALNVPPEFKYQRIVTVGPNRDDYLGPVNVSNLSAFNQYCIVPAKAQLHLLHWILFNLIIGNTDNHGKNISYFVNQNGYELAPAYDLVNVSVYEDLPQVLAFKIGDTFELDKVKANQLVEMANQMKLSPRFVAAHLKKICTEIMKHMDSIIVDNLSGPELEFPELEFAEMKFIDKLRNDIQARANRFLKQSALMSS